jgi:hypothetical protein
MQTALTALGRADFVEALRQVGPNSEKTMPQALLRFGDCLPVSADD